MPPIDFLVLFVKRKTILRVLIKGGLYRILFMGFNFLVGLFIAAISGAETFGVISLMVVNAAVFSIVSGLGADSAIVWHGASQKLNSEKIFSFTFFFCSFPGHFVFDPFTAFLQGDLQASLKSTALFCFLFLRVDLFFRTNLN
jgi:hypothetical protein